MMKSIHILCAAIALAAAIPLRAGETPRPGLNGPLLKHLQTDSLDRKLFEPEPADKLPQPAPQRESTGKTPQDLRQELGTAAISEEENPLLEVTRDMRLAQGRIAQADGGLQTQYLQRQIVATLDKLLRDARSRSQPSGGGKEESPLPTARRPAQQPPQPQSATGNPTGKPAVASNDHTPKAPENRVAQLQAIRDAIKDLWGELPERAREQMLQLAPVEDFVPQYESLIEAYFRRLAEEQGRGP
jgi:hypothetical protein